MENIKKFLELIYKSDNGMLYFYVITGSIALILIVLIIINIKQGKKQAKEDIQVESEPASGLKIQENIDEEKIEVQSVIDEKTKEEQKVEEVIEKTNISNDIPMNEDVKEIEHEDNNEVKVNDVDALDALYENQENILYSLVTYHIQLSIKYFQDSSVPFPIFNIINLLSTFNVRFFKPPGQPVCQ